MWVTDSNLDEAMEVMKTWGFKYKTVAFIQIKKRKSEASLFYGVLDNEKIANLFYWEQRLQ